MEASKEEKSLSDHEVDEQEEARIIEMGELDIHWGEGDSEPEPTHVESRPSLDDVEEILGYKFNAKRLLEEALTHHSFADKSFCCERLEYVGDSVLNLLFAKEQYFRYPDLPPGSLTRLRAANVDTEKLARVAIKHGLHRYLRHRMPVFEDQIQAFERAILDYPVHSNGLIDVPKALANVVESTIGAVFIDCNFSLDTVWKVFQSLLEPIISPSALKVHPVTELYELCQKKGLKLRFVDLWSESSSFIVFANDQLVGRGMYKAKKDIALNRAAKDALENIGRFLGEGENTHEDDSGLNKLKDALNHDDKNEFT
ncbi:ribonuclease 3-like protein 3 [Syzygium oleosum]|uniref:ribonuclease 3-like protein 3 n=1 Tax=Syzygium oleosum TaxID=219896 RepID=UPI0011D1F732|nr:ribonuclease 3-like protein 3 [Syzygium oleosum]